MVIFKSRRTKKSDQNINGIRRVIFKIKEWMSRTGDEEIDLDKFKKQIFDYTESFKFNKVVSSFMILVNENKNKRVFSLAHPTKRSNHEIQPYPNLLLPDLPPRSPTRCTRPRRLW